MPTPHPSPAFTRRSVLTTGAALAAAPLLTWAAAAPAPRWRGADEATLARLIDRVGWGCTASGAQALAQGDADAWLAGQLRPGHGALPAAAQAQIDALRISRTPVTELARQMQERQREARTQDGQDGRGQALRAWQQDMRELQREAGERFVLRALYSPSQLREKMTWFWMNHFNVFAGKGLLRALVGDYEDQAIRPHALGRFRDLLGATVRHPAMLQYLDNVRNVAGRINENYARELMELHTLGVDGGYSQQDVQELARVLTGLGAALRPQDAAPRRRMAQHDGLFVFDPRRHDDGPKTLLGQPLRGQGMDEVDEALDRLARAPATARFVTHKMALFFVGANPPAALLQALAQSFERSGGDIAAVLSTLFAAPAFRASLGQRFREPVQYVLAALRLAHGDVVLADTDPALAWMQRLAQPLYGRATPDGYPLDAAAWSGSGQMAERFEVARAIGAGAATRERGGEPAPRSVPPLAQSAYVRALQATLPAATQQALSQAQNPREWNLLFLASPTFMHG